MSAPDRSIDVFISYSSRDADIARLAKAALVRRGYRCWRAPEDLNPGQEWDEGITEAIEQCRVMLLVMTRNSAGSDQVARELVLAAQAELTIIPLRVHAIDIPSKWKYYLAGTHWLDASTKSESEAVDDVVLAVERVIPVASSGPGVSAHAVASELDEPLRRFLEANDLLVVAPALQRNALRLRDLPELSDEDLRSIGIVELGLRRRLAKAVRAAVERRERARSGEAPRSSREPPGPVAVPRQAPPQPPVTAAPPPVAAHPGPPPAVIRVEDPLPAAVGLRPRRFRLAVGLIVVCLLLLIALAQATCNPSRGRVAPLNDRWPAPSNSDRSFAPGSRAETGVESGPRIQATSDPNVSTYTVAPTTAPDFETLRSIPGEPVDGTYMVLPDGLKYVDQQVGTGVAVGSARDTVTVHYTGWLVDGTQFDSSRSRGKPSAFVLSSVIPGWTEGMIGMRVGGRRKLIIPHSLAYGERATGPIPSRATLVFDIELIGVGEAGAVR